MSAKNTKTAGAAKKAMSVNATGWVDRVLNVLLSIAEEAIPEALAGEAEWGKQLAEKRASTSRSARVLTPKDINRLHALGEALGCGGAGKGKPMAGQKKAALEPVEPEEAGPEV